MVTPKKASAKESAPSAKPLWQKLFIKGGTLLPMHAPAVDDARSAMRFRKA